MSSFIDHPYVWFLVYSFVGVLSAVYYLKARANTDKRAIREFRILIVVATAISLVSTVQVVVTSRFLSLQLFRVYHVLADVVWVPYALFVASFTGYWKSYIRSRWMQGFVAVLVGTYIALLVTNPLHGLVFESTSFVTSPYVNVVYDPGLVFLVYQPIAKAFSVTAVLTTLVALARSNSRHRGQLAALTLAGAIPFVVEALDEAGLFPTGIDGLTIGGAGFAVMVGFGLYRFRLFDVNPITRTHITNSLRDGVVTVGPDGTITECNDAVPPMLALDPGNTFDEVVDLRLSKRSSVSDIITLTDDAGRTRHYSVTVEPVHRDGAFTGYIALFRDVTGLERSKRELERQNEHLERFAETVVHDLRNTLSVAETYVGLAEDSGDSDDVAKVREAYDDLHGVIEDTLALAREGKAVTDADRQEVSLQEIVTDTWADVGSGVVSLVLEGDLTLIADPDRLETMFSELFENAVSHGGPSEIRVGVIESEAAFYVVDDGGGFDGDVEVEEVLDFGESTTGGTGYGLNIVIAVAEAHGWSCDVSDTGDGLRVEFREVSHTDRV